MFPVFKDAGHHVDDVALLYIHMTLHMCDVHMCDKAVACFDDVCFFCWKDVGHHIDDVVFTFTCVCSCMSVQFKVSLEYVFFFKLLYMYMILHTCDVHMFDKAVARSDCLCFFLFKRRGASR